MAVILPKDIVRIAKMATIITKLECEPSKISAKILRIKAIPASFDAVAKYPAIGNGAPS